MSNSVWPAVALAAWAAIAPCQAAAQVPGESAFEGRRSLRDEYRSIVLQELKESIAEWTDDLNNRKLDRLKKDVTDDVYFAPVGWSVTGVTSFVDSLKTRLPTLGGFYFTLLDFEASSNLAYALVSVRYHVASGGGAETTGNVMAEASIVFYRAGSRWKVRSYLERATAF